VVPGTPVPVQPVFLDGQREYAMFVVETRYGWVLKPYCYASQERLIADLSEVIVRAEDKARELRGV
jgi:hypothetical protein